MVNIDKTKSEYKKLANEHTRKRSRLKNFIIAYITGGIICILGQGIIDLFLVAGFPQEEANSFTAIVLIFIGGLLTGLGIYDELAQFAGGGTIVPITGFANAIVAPALEYQQEGYIMGVGAKIFSVAGPVLTYGMVTAFLIGVIKLVLI